MYETGGKGMLIIIPIGGLCNRMRVINSFYKHIRNKKIIVLWLIQDELGIHSTELFSIPEEIKIVNINLYSKLQRFLWRWIRRCLRLFFKYYEQEDIERITANGHKQNFQNIFNKKVSVCETCSELDSIQMCDIFEPTNEIKDRVKEVIGNRKYIAYHIRRTDNVDSISVSKDELFEANIEKLYEKGNVKSAFLATDDEKFKEKLLQKYPDFLFAQNTSSLMRNNVEGMKQAYVDLLCLAGADIIYGSYWSSFSEIASRIYGTDLVIVK